MRRLLTTSNVVRSTGDVAPTATQCRFIRNLHRNRQERWKGLVKDRRTFSRKWKLEMGENYELDEEKGHEREAFQNFARYKTDWGTMTIPLYVSDLSKMPPKARYGMLYDLVQERKGLSAFMKNKYLLEALECFSEMKALGEIDAKYENWESVMQNHFIYVVDEILKHSRTYVKVQHSAVASVIRAAAICDEVDFADKRNMCLSAAEHMAGTMDSYYTFSRPDSKLEVKQPWLSRSLEHRMASDIEFKAKYGWLHEKEERFPGAKEMGSPGRQLSIFKLTAYPEVKPSSKRPLYMNKNLLNVNRQIE